jgi:hypothetical protein
MFLSWRTSPDRMDILRNMILRWQNPTLEHLGGPYNGNYR